jgi:5-methyltetrahydropteroyltriglutamate--homocysteine methyltransferase
MLLPTMLVGSYAQPEGLIDRAKLASRFPSRVRAKELSRLPEAYLAIEDARIVRAELAAR